MSGINSTSPLIDRQTTSADSSSRKDRSKSLVERLFASKLTPWATVAVFLGSLYIWSSLDHSYPVFDAAAHSLDSSAVKQWLCHPRDWTVESFTNLLRMQPTYPAGSWIFNGFLKIFAGDSHWAENFILGVHLTILSVCTWFLSFKLCKDQLKANLAVIFVNCSPLILGLEHTPLIDLPHAAFYSAFMLALVSWWQTNTWKRALVAGLLLGVYCLTKQVAICYSAPLLAVMAFILLRRRSYQALGQVATIGLIAATLLCSWIVPNFQFLLNFTKIRRALTAGDTGLSHVMSVTLEYLVLLVQSFSPLMFLGLLGCAARLRVSNWSPYWPLAVSAICSIPAVVWAAISNGAISPRFGVPIMVVLAILLAEGCANILRRSKTGQVASTVLIVLSVVQAFAICFQPYTLPAKPVNKNGVTLEFGSIPLYDVLGLNDSSDFLTMTLPYQRGGDLWKQEWLLEHIENVERGRAVYVNVLVNLLHFNHGTLNIIAKERRSNIQVVTWRACMSCTADTFDFTDGDLRSMQWLVLKTGDEQQGLFDSKSRVSWGRIERVLAKGGQFVEDARQVLPDGTELVLYRNKQWIWHQANVNVPANSAPAVVPVNSAR